MRIIKEGVVPILEYVFNCGLCGCEFAVTEAELNGTSFLNKNAYICPTCGKPVSGYELQVIEGDLLPIQEEDPSPVQDEDNDPPAVDPIEGE
jgi:hypothetical protein